MTSLAELWLPILVSSVVVFVLSMLAWTVAPHHKPDIKSVGKDNEDKFMDLIQSTGLKPGQYMFPHCGSDSKYAKSDEFKAKWNRGCVANVTVYPGSPNMGKNMVLSMVVYLFVGVFVAYLLSLSIHPGDSGRMVMRIGGAAAVGFYLFGGLCGGIWFGQPARAFVTNAFDALVYGAATGAIFMFMWPSVEAAAASIPAGIPTP